MLIKSSINPTKNAIVPIDNKIKVNCVLSKNIKNVITAEKYIATPPNLATSLLCHLSFLGFSTHPNIFDNLIIRRLPIIDKIIEENKG